MRYTKPAETEWGESMAERVLDVREQIRAGQEPFADIMRAAAELGEDEDLVIVAPFEPVPLYAVLAGKGFDHASELLDGGDYRVVFRRKEAP